MRTDRRPARDEERNEARDDARALALIEAFGRTGTVFQTLGRGLHHWFDGERGFVAYFDTGSAWAAAGEPVAAPEDGIAVAEAFVVAAHARGRRACFFGTEGNLASSPRFRRVRIGEQPVWDPTLWEADVRAHRSMREQLRRARAKGVGIRELARHETDPGSATRAALDTLVWRWRASRPMAAMHFLVDVAPFEHVAHRRLFVAERGGSVLALLSLAPVPARHGWLFEHLLRDPRAPNGVSELLVDQAMRTLAADGVRWATLGLAPLAGPVNGWLRAARRYSRPFFNFAGLSAFKRKLRPRLWEPMYLAFPREAHAPLALLEGLRAFAGGSLLRFGVRTALRGPPPLLGFLSWALVPWTLAMALAPTSPWFPSRSIHAAWVAFDLLLLAGLWFERRTGGVAVARAVASAVTLDALLTLAQALLWNVPRAPDRAALLIVAVSCAGPSITAPILWGAVRRLGVLARMAGTPDAAAHGAR